MSVIDTRHQLIFQFLFENINWLASYFLRIFSFVLIWYKIRRFIKLKLMVNMSSKSLHRSMTPLFAFLVCRVERWQDEHNLSLSRYCLLTSYRPASETWPSSGNSSPALSILLTVRWEQGPVMSKVGDFNIFPSLQ